MTESAFGVLKLHKFPWDIANEVSTGLVGARRGAARVRDSWASIFEPCSLIFLGCFFQLFSLLGGLGRSWVVLVALGSSWGGLGSLLGGLESLLGGLGSLLGRPGAVLGRSWVVLGRPLGSKTLIFLWFFNDF